MAESSGVIRSTHSVCNENAGNPPILVVGQGNLIRAIRDPDIVDWLEHAVREN
jgi:hypothetical protein